MGFVTDFIGGITGANKAADAAGQAAQTQSASAQAGIDEQRRQFDTVVQLLSPYVNAGNRSLTAQSDLLGINGGRAQTGAITELENSPAYKALIQQGEEGILANASATGGLRGGNVQRALGVFRPQILSQLIQQQLGNLGGITNIGQAAASGQAAQGASTSANIANLLQQQGAALAGGQVAQGSARQAAFGDLLGGVGAVSGFFRPTGGKF